MSYSPAKIAENYAALAQKKVTTPSLALLFKAILGGAFVAFGCFSAHTVSAMLENAGTALIINSLLFPAGLAMILVAGGELFTGNCMLTLGVCKRCIRPRQLLANWAIVYLGNALGAIIIGAITIAVRQDNADFVAVAIRAAEKKAALPWGNAFLLGILCNILVCAGVWMSYSSDSSAGKIIAMYFPIVLFVLCGTEHCVANMYYFSAALFAGGSEALTLSSILLGNLLPATLGNIVGGGVLFGGALWFALFRQ